MATGTVSLSRALPEDIASAIQKNAGVILSDFNPATFNGEITRADIVHATTDGNKFTDIPTYTDFFEDVDNAPNNTKEGKEITGREIKLSCTAVTATKESISRQIGTADVTKDGDLDKITPRDLVDLVKDFRTLWFVCPLGADGFIAIRMDDTLSTGGFSLATTKGGKGTMECEYTAHYTADDPDKVPYEIFIGKFKTE